MMRKLFLQLIFASCIAVPAFTQGTIEYELRPDEILSKEVTLKGSNKFEELKLMLKVQWKSADNRLILTFDRKSVGDNDSYLLFIPILKDRKPLKDVMDCKLERKSIWSKAIKLDKHYMSYFMKSNNLSISEQYNCYMSLANNNEEEFSFLLKNTEEDFTIELTDLYVAKTEKKRLSKKDKKVLFKVLPVSLLMRPEKIIVEEVIKCCMEDIAIAYIELQQTILKTYSDALMDAQKRQNCTLFNTQKDRIKKLYEEVNTKCENYQDCEAVAPVLKKFNETCENFIKMECKAAVQQAPCNLSENELTSTNTSLRNLQMKINVKKKDGLSTADEQREYQTIKNAINPKITPECRRRFGSLIDAYTNYCTVIEGLFK